jgi:hypothetical protein
MRKLLLALPLLFALLLLIPLSCREKNASPSKEIINEIDLKRGEAISCGPPTSNLD